MSKATENVRTRRAETKAFEESKEELIYGSKGCRLSGAEGVEPDYVRYGQVVKNENNRNL